MTTRSRFARACTLGGLAVLVLGGAACGDDDEDATASGSASASASASAVEETTTTDAEATSDTEPASEGGESRSDFNPDTDDATVAICDAYFRYIVSDDPDPADIETVNLAADVLELRDVRNASFFLLENPNPTDPEDQRQHEDARTILQTDIEESGLCDEVPAEGSEGDMDE